jgi:mRNA interferase RelE/StbE
MARYRIAFKRSVIKDLRQIPNQDVQRILKRIDDLADEPRGSGAEKLTGEEVFRVRQGNYRILYTVEDDVVTVTIVRVGHRRDVYR